MSQLLVSLYLLVFCDRTLNVFGVQSSETRREIREIFLIFLHFMTFYLPCKAGGYVKSPELRIHLDRLQVMHLWPHDSPSDQSASYEELLAATGVM